MQISRALAAWVLAFAPGCASSVAASSNDAGSDVGGSALADAVSQSEVGDAGPVIGDPFCRTDRLPTTGTTCNASLFAPGSYCRIGSCDVDGSGDCRCVDGIWQCGVQFRHGWGCGTPPYCFDQYGPPCASGDAGAVCPGGLVPLYAHGPWDATRGCWPSFERFFGCFEATADAGTDVCFTRDWAQQFFLSKTGRIPTSTEFRACTDAQASAHPASARCE